ncbi:MAG: metallophosphoesterase [Candidatus Zipacnadales bacterium]
MDRNKFLPWLLAGTGLGVGAAVAYRLLTERWHFTVTRAIYGIRNLPPDLDGLVVAHLTDFHAGACTPIELIRKAVSLTNRLKPDVILLTGDYVDDFEEDLPLVAEAFVHFKAPYGVYAVLGNHDYCVSADAVEAALKAANITVLRNASHRLGRGPQHLWIVGLDDTAGYWGDFPAAFDGVPGDEPVILLSHVPDVLPRAESLGVELILAGHTHGGQVQIPAVGAPHAPVRLSARFVAGSRRAGHTRLHVNRGIGMTVLPIRLNCPPEIGLHTLYPIVRP